MHFEPEYRVLGKLIKDHRERIGLSRKDFAEKLDFTLSSLINVEAGRQRLPFHKVAACSRFLGFSLRDFELAFNAEAITVVVSKDLKNIRASILGTAKRKKAREEVDHG